MADAPASRGMGVTVLALGLAAGIALGASQDSPLVWPWLCGAATFWALAVLCRFGSTLLCLPMMAISLGLFGAAWFVLRHERTTPDNLAAWLGPERVLVRLSGSALAPPELRARTAGSMARFDYREPATFFPMQVDALLDRDGRPTPITGRVLVRIDETTTPFSAGDRLEALGFLSKPIGPRNPGEFDYRELAKSLGQAGMLTVAGRDLLNVDFAPRASVLSAFRQWRHDMRVRASAWLRADLPPTGRGERDSMLANLLLGERDAQIDGWYESFQRVGLAHIMAISGFHLSVLAGFVLLAARMIGGSRRTHGLLIIGIVLLYLMLVEVRMPVLRAGIMTIAGCLGLMFGRHLRIGGLVSLSAIVLLLWKPDEAFNAGFQLTYGVVLGLIHLAPPVRRRWFGRPDPEAATTGEIVLQWTYTAISVSAVAWLVATPIGLWHFGMLSPLGAVLSVIAVPMSAVILMLGYLKIALGALLPSAAMLLGVPLAIGAEILLVFVLSMDQLPLAAAHAPPPGALWTAAALASVVIWCLAASRSARAAAIIAMTGLGLFLAWPQLPFSRADPALRLDMLAVGDGSCHLVRQGDAVVVFDAGSSTDLNAGRRSIIPAMRRMGVRKIDAIAISHANLDHYSSVLELIAEFNVQEILLTPQAIAEAQADPLGPLTHMLAGAARRRVLITTASVGTVRRFGEMTWTWLHPSADDAFERVNDRSMVVRIEAHGRRVLYTGDVQRAAMAQMLSHDRAMQLAADVMELPHHGSRPAAHAALADAFVGSVGARVIMQSTGWERWRRDGWAETLRDVERLVTARDGACAVRIEPDGRMSVQRFLDVPATSGSADE